MSKPPKKIKVGPYNIKIREVERPGLYYTGQENEQLYGCYVAKDGAIYLQKSLEVTFKKETLIHEILHAVWEATGANFLNELDEEKVIRATSPTLLLMMQENPELVRYLTA